MKAGLSVVPYGGVREVNFVGKSQYFGRWLCMYDATFRNKSDAEKYVHLLVSSYGKSHVNVKSGFARGVDVGCLQSNAVGCLVFRIWVA